MAGEKQGAAHATYPEARTWEEWRQVEQPPLELQHEPVHLAPLSPSDAPTPKRRRPQLRRSAERVPQARPFRHPKHPHRHTPAARVPHPDVIVSSGPTANVPRTPRPFLESSTPEHPVTQRRLQPSGQQNSLVPTVLPEERTTILPLPEARTSESSKPEETASDRKKELPEPEETASVRKKQLPGPEETASNTRTTKKLHRYDGKLGRKHTEKQIEEILDWYLQTGGLPHYVSERQRYSYRHHRSLPERRRLLQQQGITLVIPETGAHERHIIPLERAGRHRSRRATGGV